MAKIIPEKKYFVVNPPPILNNFIKIAIKNVHVMLQSIGKFDHVRIFR